MHILILPASYPPVLGGLQTVAHTLAQHALERGHSVHVVTNRYPRSLPPREMLDGVPVERLLFLWPRLGYLRRRRGDLFLASWYHGPFTLLRLAARMRSFHPDVVNVHFPDAQTPYVLWLRRHFRFRLVVSLHGDEVLRWTKDGRRATGDDRGLGRLRAILQEADAVTACSGWLLGKAEVLEPSVARKGHVIHNGVDLERFEDRTPYRHPRPYFLAYGRLTYKKGFDMLLDAFAQVQSLAQDVDLILAGAGEEEEALQRQAQRLGLAERVYFFGRATPEEVVHLLNGCRFVVVPSREEPFGIVALEALAAGKPVLATRVGGLPEVVEERRPTGDEGRTMDGAGCDTLLVEPTVEGLAEGLRAYLRRLDKMPGWGEMNRQRAAQFTWEQVAVRYFHAFGLGRLS